MRSALRRRRAGVEDRIIKRCIDIRHGAERLSKTLSRIAKNIV